MLVVELLGMLGGVFLVLKILRMLNLLGKCCRCMFCCFLCPKVSGKAVNVAEELIRIKIACLVAVATFESGIKTGAKISHRFTDQGLRSLCILWNMEPFLKCGFTTKRISKRTSDLIESAMNAK